MRFFKRIRAAALLAASAVLLGMAAGPLAAQEGGSVRGRVIEAGTQRPLAGVQVVVANSRFGTTTNAAGEYVIQNVPAGAQVVRASMVGYEGGSQTVQVAAGAAAQASFTLTPATMTLNALVVTALGQTTEQRSLGIAQQSVKGSEVAETKRENFINALQGRVAGVEVVSTSGVPGASSSITIRGVSSISSSNQPLVIIDGLPMDNKTLNTGVLASDANSRTMFANRGVDFTNRAADINPEDIENITVLKGPEASALYGIDAANGAIVITTKRGRVGSGGLEYSNSFRIERVNFTPEVQRVYGVSGVGSSTFSYFGAPYADTTTFYNNIDGFFQTALTQKHDLSFSGAAEDGRLSYRLAGGLTDQKGVVPGSSLKKVNLTGATRAQVNSWLNADLNMQFINSDNSQSFKGAGGPLIGLLVWPQDDDAKNYLTPGGIRRRLTTLAEDAEVDNPYFSINKNSNTTRTNRVIANLGLTLSPVSWGNLRTNIGVDAYTNHIQVVRHPESTWGSANRGIIDVANDVTRNVNAQTVFTVERQQLPGGVGISGLVGQSISDARSDVDALQGMDFLEPDFVSANNANQRTNLSTAAQRRLLSGYGSVTLDYNEYLYVTATGRNDWTSTIPKGANSFFYPSVSSSFIFSDAFPTLGNFMTGKLRAAYAEVGKDARPYAYRPALQYKTTSYGGYGYNFTGPNRGLKPEFARSYEIGTELGFFDNRLGLDATVYRKQTKDQIVNDIRGSYATGFVLFNLNGAETRNQGVELSLRGTPVLREGFSWDFLVNFDRSSGETLRLPNALPETYVSDTWLYGNVRNGTQPGLSTRSLTGLFYLRNKQGDLLIDPTSGLPIRSTTFIDGGYDRQPDFTVGISNTLRRGRVTLSFLVDIRKGGDVLNATEHYLTTRGLSERTLDREEPRVIKGVLRDGKENTANPTPNTIVVVPAVQTGYYTNMSEELFIEKDINWVRLRDVTVRVGLPERFGRNASVFVTGTDLFLKTNYSGLDPIVNGNSAAVGGSGGAGIDFGNFPMPRGFNFGIRTSF